MFYGGGLAPLITKMQIIEEQKRVFLSMKADIK